MQLGVSALAQMMQLAFCRWMPGGVTINPRAIVSTGVQISNQAGLLQKLEAHLLKTEDQDHSLDKAQHLGEEGEGAGCGDDTAKYLNCCIILVNIIAVVCLMLLLSNTISFFPFLFVYLF